MDPLSSTDLEDLMNFAADLFEFVHQEYALLLATFGESRVLGAGLAVLAAGLASFAARPLSSQRLK